MYQYLLRRMLLFIPTLLLATVLVFVLFSIVPGDAASYLLTGEDAGGQVTNQDFENLRKELGLDRPIYIQYADWVWGVLRWDLGDSLYYGTPFGLELVERFARTFELAILAIIMAFVVAVPLGVISAMKQDRGVDYASRIIALVGIAMPTFWIGILVIYALTYGFGWLPPLEYAHLWEDPIQNLQLMLLPAAVIGFHDMAFTARVTRSAMLEVMREDYMRTARSKGLREWIVVSRHAMKNAMLPVITVSGYQFGRLLGGVIIVEQIFVVPGVGTFLIDAINHRDFPVIQGVILMTAGIVLLLNLIIDMLYGVLDPRIRYS